jgi:Heterokaryon incompatibility protein (HET)
MFKLTNDNIAALRKSIPFKKLCKTFQQAVITTRALGFQYLWIDSLCIIQDNDRDWQRESTRMSNVYGDAVVNIAASSAQDGSVGLFCDRSIIRASRYRIHTNTSEVFEPGDRLTYDRCLRQSVLSGRAWCFQERFLARRTLHFTNEQIFCECRVRTVSEAWLEGIPAFMSTSKDRRFPADRDTLDAWFRAVSLYSEASLTFSKDKLVAISGIARHIASKNSDKYVAGLWLRNFEAQLCWQTEGSARNYRNFPRPGIYYSLDADSKANVPYRAPSWSWAATDQPKTWINQWLIDISHPSKLLASVVKVGSLRMGQDVFGQVRDAALKMKCGPLINDTFFTLPFEDDEGRRKSKNGSPIIQLMKFFTIYYDFDRGDECKAESSFLLPVFEGERYFVVYGLILQAAKGRHRGYFTRVGVWYGHLYGTEGYESFIYALLQEKEALMDESMYQDILELDDGWLPQYIIRLI